MPRLSFSFEADKDNNYYSITAEGQRLSEASDVYFVLWQKSNKSGTEQWLTPRCSNGDDRWSLDYQPNGSRGCTYCLHVYKNKKTYVDEAEFYVKDRADYYC